MRVSPSWKKPKKKKRCFCGDRDEAQKRTQEVNILLSAEKWREKNQTAGVAQHERLRKKGMGGGGAWMSSQERKNIAKKGKNARSKKPHSNRKGNQKKERKKRYQAPQCRCYTKKPVPRQNGKKFGNRLRDEKKNLASAFPPKNVSKGTLKEGKYSQP